MSDSLDVSGLTPEQQASVREAVAKAAADNAAADTAVATEDAQLAPSDGGAAPAPAPAPAETTKLPSGETVSTSTGDVVTSTPAVQPDPTATAAAAPAPAPVPAAPSVTQDVEEIAKTVAADVTDVASVLGKVTGLLDRLRLSHTGQAVTSVVEWLAEHGLKL